MKRGVNVGLNQPHDPDYTLAYDPIDPTRIYCGDADQLPDGYDRFGYAHECLQKGVGVGKTLKARRACRTRRPIQYIILLVLIFAMIAHTFK